MRCRVLPALALAAAGLTACDSAVNGNVTANESGGSTVNGSVHVPAGLHSGAVETVNGSIHIEDNAAVRGASTVNGSVELGAHAVADSVETVNGHVTLGDGARVARDVATINGAINLKIGADVGGSVGNVNGHIVLVDAAVAGRLHTVSGDIDVGGGSHVGGGILVERDSSWFSWYPRKPRIVIGPGAVVQGDLRFERAVLLYVSDRATIGPVSGATAIRFSGEQPPSG